jgi:hypothetical protein
MALRGLILMRLKAAWIINRLIAVVPQILAISVSQIETKICNLNASFFQV